MPEDGGLIGQALIGLKPVNAWVHTYTKPQTSSTRSRGLGWRIHESVEDTKLSTNKQHSLSLAQTESSLRKVVTVQDGFEQCGHLLQANLRRSACHAHHGIFDGAGNALRIWITGEWEGRQQVRGVRTSSSEKDPAEKRLESG